MARAKRAPSQRPQWVPKPLPGNEDAFTAFYIVQYCREYTFGGTAGFNWPAVETKLKPHGLWNEEMIEKLSVIELMLFSVEHAVKAESEELKQKDADSPKKRRRAR